MMLGLVAFAGIAAVSEGFAAVSPARWPLGSQTSSAFAADAAGVNRPQRPRGVESSATKMMSQATVGGAGAGASTKEPVYDQKSWALVSCLFFCSAAVVYMHVVQTWAVSRR